MKPDTMPVPDPSGQDSETNESESVDQPQEAGEGEQELPDSVDAGLATLIDLGSGLSGLRELAKRKDVFCLGIGDNHVEAVERVIVDVVEALGVGTRLIEAVAAANAAGEADPVEDDPEPTRRVSDLVHLEEVMDPRFPTPMAGCEGGAPSGADAEGASRNGSGQQG